MTGSIGKLDTNTSSTTTNTVNIIPTQGFVTTRSTSTDNAVDNNRNNLFQVGNGTEGVAPKVEEYFNKFFGEKAEFPNLSFEDISAKVDADLAQGLLSEDEASQVKQLAKSKLYLMQDLNQIPAPGGPKPVPVTDGPVPDRIKEPVDKVSKYTNMFSPGDPMSSKVDFESVNLEEIYTRVDAAVADGSINEDEAKQIKKNIEGIVKEGIAKTKTPAATEVIPTSFG